MNPGDSTDRTLTDYLLFGMAVLGVLIAGAAVITSSPPIAVLGLAILLIAVIAIWLRPSPEE